MRRPRLPGALPEEQLFLLLAVVIGWRCLSPKDDTGSK